MRKILIINFNDKIHLLALKTPIDDNMMHNIFRNIFEK